MEHKSQISSSKIELNNDTKLNVSTSDDRLSSNGQVTGSKDSAATDDINKPQATAIEDQLKSGSIVNSSAVTTNSEGKVPAPTKRITKHRKEEFLLEARKDRIRWILEAPLPYERLNKAHAAGTSDGWDRDSRLQTFKSSHAVTYLPTALSLLNSIYNSSDEGPNNDLGSHIEKLLGDSMQDNKELALPNGKQILESEIDVLSTHLSEDLTINTTNELSILKAYQNFLSKLQDPACGKLVQDLRIFCRNIADSNNSDALATSLKTCIRSKFEEIKTHVIWKKELLNSPNLEHLESFLRRSIESFVYAQCYNHITEILSTPEVISNEKIWSEKLQNLSFMQPRHLDISCLDDPTLNLDELLKVPTEAILSIDAYYSAFEKLQRVLALYHGVNAALSKALNQRKSSSEGNQQRILPSADDVLPTIILIVIRAQPKNLLLHLKMLEDFSPAEYLRGEAGYAYTNLYGAVQFLHELDMKEEPKRLSITPEEYQDGLKQSKVLVSEKLESIKNRMEKDAQENELEEKLLAASHIPPLDVRQARQRGEPIDVNWALRWQEQNGNKALVSVALSEGPAHQRVDSMDSISAFIPGNEDFRNLPPGFQRNYSFLTTQPEDIKLSDLPKLLDEYRMLVRTTETLLAEKSAQAIKARKVKVKAIEDKLFAAAHDIDPSLLPSPSKSKKTSNLVSQQDEAYIHNMK